MDCKEIKPVNPKGNQDWIFIGRTDTEAEAPVLWTPDMKSWLSGKYPNAGKDWGQEEKGAAEDEMVGWYHWLDGQSLSKLWDREGQDSEGQGSLACCSPWDCKVRYSLLTEQHLIYLNTLIQLNKGNQSWIFFGRTDTEAEAPILWPPDF